MRLYNGLYLFSEVKIFHSCCYVCYQSSVSLGVQGCLIFVQGSGVGSEGSRLEAWMKSHKSEVANITFYLHQPGNSVCVGKDTSKQNIQNMKANVKSKQQQLYKVVYLQVTIIHNGNCDKMINYQAHDLHLKPISYISVNNVRHLTASYCNVAHQESKLLIRLRLSARLVNRDKDLIATTDAHRRPVRVQ